MDEKCRLEHTTHIKEYVSFPINKKDHRAA